VTLSCFERELFDLLRLAHRRLDERDIRLAEEAARKLAAEKEAARLRGNQ
jgi:hypothetical protein